MATEESATAQDPNDIGTFISPIVVGYSEPDMATIVRIQAIAQAMCVAPERQLLKNLMTIKLLVPNESRRLQIYTIPEAISIIAQLNQRLLQRYHEEE